MGRTEDSASGFAELDDISASAYGQAVRLGMFDHEAIAENLALDPPETRRAEKVLRHLKLLQPMPGDPSVLVPVGPDVAAADLVGAAERQIRDLQNAVTDVRTRLMSLTPLLRGPPRAEPGRGLRPHQRPRARPVDDRRTPAALPQ